MTKAQADWAVKQDWCVSVFEDLDGGWSAIVRDPVPEDTDNRSLFTTFQNLCEYFATDMQ
ncbi:hypothetical protein [Pseudomonas fontis]|uniref:Uncharacterized protein n=1 Tax=Pseudomonas fontis TaxID=2942633 RepID=A0ABT5NL37_9PSED|nr:hypothetical protein [Pseudomonas fontis]MDD0975398.1 hypothetical protein [Pseudomonas fontis]MDD0989240.1 hypothetical protein [Pseudomonas fontis]